MKISITGRWIALLSLILSVSALIIALYASGNRSKAIVSFDLKATQTSFSEALASNKAMTEAQKQTLASRFGKTLETIINEYAHDHRVVILVKPAVVSGSKDITADIQQQILAKLQGAGS